MILLKEKCTRTFSWAQGHIDRRPRGLEGHNISGDATGSWFLKPAISSKKRWGGYRRTTLMATLFLAFRFFFVNYPLPALPTTFWCKDACNDRGAPPFFLILPLNMVAQHLSQKLVRGEI